MGSRGRILGRVAGQTGIGTTGVTSVVDSDYINARVEAKGITEVANTAALGTGITGDQKFVTANKSLYIYDGSEWDRVSTGNNETPRLTTTPASSHALNSNGTTSSITIAATDPEGFPITYSHDINPTSPNQITNVAESNGTFTLTPSTNTDHAGSFTLRLKASDGISTISHPIAVSLAFGTTYTYDTSESIINTNYTADNKVECTVTYNQNSATPQQSGPVSYTHLTLPTKA